MARQGAEKEKDFTHLKDLDRGAYWNQERGYMRQRALCVRRRRRRRRRKSFPIKYGGKRQDEYGEVKGDELEGVYGDWWDLTKKVMEQALNGVNKAIIVHDGRCDGFRSLSEKVSRYDVGEIRKQWE